MTQIKRIGVRMELDFGFKHHADVFAGMLDYARQNPDWEFVVDEWADRGLPVRDGKPLPYDGILGRITAEGAKRVKRHDLPAVNVWYSSPARGLPGVYADYHAGGELVAEHLLSRGFRNLGVLGPEGDLSTQQQASGMKKFANDAGFDGWFGSLYLGNVTNRASWLRSVRAIERWMKDWQLPLGLLIRAPAEARLVIELARNRGWHVPEQIAIVCSYNFGILCERPEPSLSGLEVPFEQCGYEAARMLDRLIEDKRRGKSPFADPQIRLLPPVGVFARHSTDFLAVADPLVSNALRYIAEQLAKPLLDAESVARMVGVSRRSLDARFQEKLGKTVAGEILRLRLERVKRELAGSTLSIEQIARNSGFGSTRTFNEQFLRSMQMSPRTFRERVRQKGPPTPVQHALGELPGSKSSTGKVTHEENVREAQASSRGRCSRAPGL